MKRYTCLSRHTLVRIINIYGFGFLFVHCEAKKSQNIGQQKCWKIKFLGIPGGLKGFRGADHKYFGKVTKFWVFRGDA